MSGNHTVWLVETARPETLLRRLGDCLERPLPRELAAPQRTERLAAWVGERRAASVPAGVLDTDEGTAAEIVEALMRRLGNGEIP